MGLFDTSIEDNLTSATQSGLLGLGVDEKMAQKIAPWLAIAPQFLPFVGAGVGVDNTVRALDKGNYGEAAFEGAMTLLGEIPVVGDVAGKAIRGGADRLGIFDKNPNVSRGQREAAEGLLESGFTDQAVSSAVKQAEAYKSREALTLMDIDEFLNLAEKGYAPDKFDALRDVEKFDEVPFLSIGYRDGSDGVAHVTGHEGRHRAMTLRERGETQIPVRIRGDIRWDQQSTPNFDYIEDWPTLLASQNDGVTTPFPFKRGESGLIDSTGMALRSKYNPPKKPTPKPEDYDVGILAELLEEFNF